MQNPIFWIAANEVGYGFPDADAALSDPDGLLAAGGDLSCATLLEAYSRGIFPWFSADQPILWWSPDPRAVFSPPALKVSRSLRRTLQRQRFQVSCDTDFAGVIRECAGTRPGQSGTWLTREMIAAYTALHEQGHAHSVECRHRGRLVGGLYGVAIGRVFFGESMFSRMNDASKVALAHLMHNLRHWQFELVDCQVYSEHLRTLGATRMPRTGFIRELRRLCAEPPAPGAWCSWRAPDDVEGPALNACPSATS
jgi:leucyl/phenylalanyl-tRNA--protein transferase